MKIRHLALILGILGLILLASCTSKDKEYVIKQYGPNSINANQFNTTNSQNSNQTSTKPAEPAKPISQPTPQPAPAVSVVSAPSQPPKTPQTNTAQTTQTNTSTAAQGAITKVSKTISTEHLDFKNVNVIDVTGTKNVELTVDGKTYLFADPRVDTDQTLCIINVNKADYIVDIDSDQPLNGITMNLRRARSANNQENSFCEFMISTT